MTSVPPNRASPAAAGGDATGRRGRLALALQEPLTTVARLRSNKQVASDSEIGLPISGIGGISGWRDAAEFILLGCQSLQLCTAPMHWGFRMVEDMIDGLKNWMDDKGFRTIEAGIELVPDES